MIVPPQFVSFVADRSNSQTLIVGLMPHSPVARYRPHLENATAVIAFFDEFSRNVCLSFLELKRTTVHLQFRIALIILDSFLIYHNITLLDRLEHLW